MVDIEMKEIPLELRKMRLQKQNLGDEINKLSNEKVMLREEIIKVKKDLEALKEKGSELTFELNKLINEKKKVMLGTQKEIEIAKNATKQLHVEKDEILVLIKKNAEIGIQNNKRDAELKKKDAQLSLDRQVLGRTEKILEVKQGELTKGQKELNLKEGNLSSNRADIEDKKDRLNRLLKEAQEVKAQYESKFEYIEKEESVLKSKIIEHNKAIEACQIQEQKTEALNEDLAQIIKETEAKGQSFDKMSTELENERKRVEILDLKLQKLARDKGLEKELKELKESLK